MYCIVLSLVALCLLASNEANAFYGFRSCVNATVPLCRSMPYRSMVLPNFFYHTTVREVIAESSQWTAIAKLRCHPAAVVFACSLYSPVCVDSAAYLILPCRSLCQQVRDSCSPVLQRFGMGWPAQINCNYFPESNGMCISAEDNNMRLRWKDLADISDDSDFCPCSNSLDESKLREVACSSDVVFRANAFGIDRSWDSNELISTASAPLFTTGRANLRRILLPEFSSGCACTTMLAKDRPVLFIGRTERSHVMVTYAMPSGRPKQLLRMFRQLKRHCQ